MLERLLEHVACDMDTMVLQEYSERVFGSMAITMLLENYLKVVLAMISTNMPMLPARRSSMLPAHLSLRLPASCARRRRMWCCARHTPRRSWTLRWAC